MENTLKQCPFCGAKPEPPKKIGGSDERMGYNFSMQIACRCGASISRDSSHDKQGWCNDKGEALKAVVEAWNRRSSLT